MSQWNFNGNVLFLGELFLIDHIITTTFMSKVIHVRDKLIIILVKRLKIITKCCLSWIFVFHSALYCCARYPNIEYHTEIFKNFSSKNIAQKVMAKFGFGCRFHCLNIPSYSLISLQT